MRTSLLTALCILYATAALALAIDAPLPDAAQEAQARTLFTQLRCVVCEGQSLAESNAALAVQMRAHVREMLANGKSEGDILEFFRSRYGNTILMQPPLTMDTALLWSAPIWLLGVGGWLVFCRTRAAKGNI